MSDLRPLNRAYLAILSAFYEAGGSGELDMHHRVIVGPTRHPMQGDPGAWLVLVSRGLVAGERGKILLTQEGRDEAEREIAGRTREAS